MRIFSSIALAASLCATAISQYTAVKYYEPSSGITYASVALPSGLTYRIALPQTSTSSDAILQIVAPVKYGWCGLAWGGRMTNNPLSVAWPTKSNSGQKAIVSSRIAVGYSSIPAAYTGASYSYLSKAAPTTNSTHWTLTARCQGCTRWTGTGQGDVNLDTQAEATFAYACATVAPTTPTSNSSNFQRHEEQGIWPHNLALARNASYSTWVA